MKWLVGYSTCAHTRKALEAAGNEVWTCDLRADPHPRHLQCDIWEVLGDRWDAAILHPPCTYLTTAAAWAYKDPDFDKYPGVGYHQKIQPTTLTGACRRDARKKSLENFRRLLKLPYPKAIENPAGSFINKAIRPPDQVIQLYEFGEDASKATGFWLDRLPFLVPTERVPGRIVESPKGSGRFVERWANQTDSGQNRMSPGEFRWLERSRTYPGVASAMGTQWGRLSIPAPFTESPFALLLQPLINHRSAA